MVFGGPICDVVHRMHTDSTLYSESFVNLVYRKTIDAKQTALSRPFKFVKIIIPIIIVSKLKYAVTSSF